MTLILGDWSAWTPCDRRVNGRQVRRRQCNAPQQHQCPFETRKCNIDEEGLRAQCLHVHKTIQTGDQSSEGDGLVIPDNDFINNDMIIDIITITPDKDKDDTSTFSDGTITTPSTLTETKSPFNRLFHVLSMPFVKLKFIDDNESIPERKAEKETKTVGTLCFSCFYTRENYSACVTSRLTRKEEAVSAGR